MPSGGKRNNSGRKPLTRKKSPLTIYLYDEDINRVGKDDARITAVSAVEKKSKKIYEKSLVKSNA